MPLRGGGVGPLMANAILNFHFDYLTTSLKLSFVWFTSVVPGCTQIWSVGRLWEQGARWLCSSPARSGLSLSYREIIECRYIGLFSISKSIWYWTSHIEYLHILKTSDFLSFLAENSENSPKILKTHKPKSSTTTTTPKIPKIRRKFQKIWKFDKNFLKRRSFLRP